MKKIITVILAGIMLVYLNGCEKEYETGLLKATVYNRKMEKINEFDRAYSYRKHGDNDEDTENLQVQMREQYGYECMSEFKNGFSFVREESIGLPLGFSVSEYVIFSGGYDTQWSEIPRIMEEYEAGYKFIDINGKVIINELEADVAVETVERSMTEPLGRPVITMKPSYFTEYGVAVAKRGGKFGLINTSGEVLFDFIYDEITISDENTVILVIGTD